MVTWGIVSSCMLFVTNETIFYVMRFVLGLAEAGFFPGIIFYLTLWYPSRLRSLRTAWFVAAIPLAGVIGNPISCWIMDTLSGTAGLAGWQWLFLAEGIPSIIVGLSVLKFPDSKIVDAKWLSSMPLFWPIPSAFLTGTAAAAGIGIVNSVGNLGGYVGPNVAIWVKQVSGDPSAALYAIAGLLLVGAAITIVFIPKSLAVKISSDET